VSLNRSWPGCFASSEVRSGVVSHWVTLGPEAWAGTASAPSKRNELATFLGKAGETAWEMRMGELLLISLNTYK
jgi:hypothetical protein